VNTVFAQASARGVVHSIGVGVLHLGAGLAVETIGEMDLCSYTPLNISTSYLFGCIVDIEAQT